MKCTPYEVHNNKVSQETIKKNIELMKNKSITKLNENREYYTENRKEGFIKNYKAARHKEEPKYRKKN